MKIKYFTNAMVLINGKNTKVLSDPWITFDNKSNTNYFNFPENKYTKQQIKKIKPDYIYISHSHPDHYDLDTLNLFGKKIKIIIANFENNYFEKILKRKGFKNVIVAKEDGKIRLNKNDFAYIKPAETTDELDSISFFNIDGINIINLNDNIENYDQTNFIKKKFGNIDIALLPYCGFGVYPLRYSNLSNKQKFLAAENKKQQTRENLLKYVEILKPKFVIPFAGEVILAGKIAKSFHKFSGIGSKTDAIKYVKKYYKDFSPVLMSPNCIFDFKTGKVKGKFQDTIFGNHKKYVDLISRKKNIYDDGGKFYVNDNLQISLQMLMKKAIKNINFQRKKREIEIPNTIPYLSTGNGQVFKLDLKKEDVKILNQKQITDSRYEIFIMQYSLMLGLLTKHFVFSNVVEDIGYYRSPNRYDERLHFLMNFMSV